MTLNFNHVHGVLGGKHDGGLQLPSQLLPFLVGLFSFVRILYETFKVKWGESPEEEALSAGEEPPRDGILVRSASFDSLQQQGELETQPHPPHRSQSYNVVSRSLAVRLLVSWLPWLGLVVHPTAEKSRLSILVKKGTGLSDLQHDLGGETVVIPAKREGSD